MKTPKHSKLAIMAGGFYLLIAVVVFVMHLYSVKTNVADSGESAIPLFMLALPWIMLIPAKWIEAGFWAWAAYPVLWMCIGFNALLIYALTAFIIFMLSKSVKHILTVTLSFKHRKEK